MRLMVAVVLMMGSSAYAADTTLAVKAGGLHSSAATGGTAIAPGIAWGGVVGSNLGYEVSYLDGSLGTTGKDRSRVLTGSLVFWAHMGVIHPKLKLGGGSVWTKTPTGTTWNHTANLAYGGGLDVEISRNVLLGLEWNKLSNDVSFAGMTLTWK